MLTGNGVARGTAAQVKANPVAFGFKATFIPKGHDVIMGVPLAAKHRTAIPLFALKPSVTIPGRHFIDATLDQNRDWIQARFEPGDRRGGSVSRLRVNARPRRGDMKLALDINV